MDLRDVDDGITEWQTVEIPLGNKEKWRLTNVYIPSERAGDCRGSKRETAVTTRYWPKEKFDLLVGDFNAHASSWDEAMETESGVGDKRGEMIEEWMENNDMVAINTGKPTHVCRKTGKQATPDITIVHSDSADRYEWKVLDKLGASDHFPILITKAAEGMSKVNDKVKHRWNLQKANWDEFRKQVEEELPNNYGKKKVKKLEKILRKTIVKAANKHIGTKAQKVNAKPGYSDKVKQEIEIRNRMKGRVKEAGGREKIKETLHNILNG